MRITDRLKQGILGRAEKGQESSKSNRSTEARSKDEQGTDPAVRVSISSLAQRLSQYSGVVNEDEVLRQSRIEALRDRIKNGSYAVDAHAVAESIVRYARNKD